MKSCFPRTQSVARFEVITAVSIKITVFWDPTPCKLSDIERRFTGTSCLSHKSQMLRLPEAAGSRVFRNVDEFIFRDYSSTSETTVVFIILVCSCEGIEVIHYAIISFNLLRTVGTDVFSAVQSSGL
jgi:hypothetical protein